MNWPAVSAISHPVSPIDRVAPRLVRIWTNAQGAGVLARFSRLLLLVLGIDWCPLHVGVNLRMPHAAAGSVVHRTTVIGNDVVIFHNVTVGRADPDNDIDLPAGKEGVHVEDGVIVGTGASILFRQGQIVTIGRNAVIGANSVILHSVAPGERWAGVPARRISTA